MYILSVNSLFLISIFGTPESTLRATRITGNFDQFVNNRHAGISTAFEVGYYSRWAIVRVGTVYLKAKLYSIYGNKSELY